MTSAASNAPEMTVKAVGLGIFLAFVFGSANAYLGMRAGQTVAATIPAAVVAVAVFRIPAFRGGLLEQNITRTAASVGEALVAGAIFTIPAFMMVDVGGVRLWADMRAHYWDATMILLAGGLIGVFFIILLRRPLVVDADLPWPESVASYEIVRSSESASEAPRYIFGAMAFGGAVQILKSGKGLQVFQEFSEGFLNFPRSVIRHFNFDKAPIGDVTHLGGIPWSTPSLSPALIGIGYIIGPTLASINVSGGIIAWWVLIPLLLFFDPDLPHRLGIAAEADWTVLSYSVWFNVVRPIAVGTMLVGAGYTLFSMRASIARSLTGAFSASAAAAKEGIAVERTERDIPPKWVIAAILILLAPITLLYYYFTGGWMAAVVAALVMSLTGFLLSAVGGYLVGLVGSSNQPLSGLTLSALVIAALLMVAIGVKGIAGVGAVLGVASVVACAASVSGSLIQDLKAGHLLGGTPWKMQVVEIIAVVLLAFFLMGPIIALHQANLDTGGIGGRALPAPQAGLMAQLAKGIVGGQMAWGLLAAGAAFGFALVLCGARAPMLVAVGMYLPFDTSSAIFVGGLMKLVADHVTRRYESERRQKFEERGTLLASGLIAGEAIVGILLAVFFLTGISSITWLLTGSDQFGFVPAWGGWLSLIGFASIGYVLIRIPARKL
ncbi:MAG: oligopeptide transporter, OPT family [Bryobacteraceae bacterium]|nr:oligopeptide transporter, OPT family [Bryobacterales bacterium]MEB2360640.1 oligopeptide transporter, OPT family [Bryobacterales bacterium]NUN00218.1 oligopeptide transporter, OPT family [Bryobacteraceae bacterium]